MKEYKCKYCNEIFNFEKPQQMGAHVINCLQNPNREARINKIAISLTIDRIKIIKNCLKCGTEFSQFKTEREIESNKDIAVFCSKSCANSHTVSDKMKNDISKSLSGREYPERQKREIRQCVICGINFKCVPSSTKRTCSNKDCSSKWISIQVTGKTGGWRPKKSFVYNGIKLDSSWEVELAKRLDFLDIKWESSGKRYFSYQDMHGKIRKYYPDFYLIDYDLYLECKGAWTQEVIHKMKDIQMRNVFNLIILDDIKEIKSFNI